MQNESRKTGLLRLRHLREVNEAKAEEMADLRPRFEALAQKEKPRVVSSYQLFQTPQELAEMAADAVGLHGRILEPSAGLGRLYRAIRRRHCGEVVLVEESADCCRELYEQTKEDESCQIFQRDFLDCTAKLLGKFDCIVMNPPFERGRDIKHIEHALTLLNPGGRLVSFCYAGVKQERRFGDIWQILPSGSFKSEGTRADVAFITIEK